MIPKQHEKQEVAAETSTFHIYRYLHNFKVAKSVWPSYATRIPTSTPPSTKRGLGGQEPGHMRHMLQGELEAQTFQAWLSMGCGANIGQPKSH